MSNYKYNNRDGYEGQGLRGPIWTLAGTSIASILQNNGNGILGGILGGNNNGLGSVAAMASQAAGCAVNDKFSTLEAEIARLKAEKYSDNSDIAVYKQTREENKDLQDRLLGNWIKPLADEAAANKVKIATLEADVSKNKEIAELQIKLVEERNRTEHAQLQGAIGLMDQRLHCVERKVDAITAVRVPNTAVCPGWGPVTITPTAPAVAEEPAA